MVGNAFVIAVTKNAGDCPVTFSPDMSEEAANMAAGRIAKQWATLGQRCEILVLDTGRPLVEAHIETWPPKTLGPGKPPV